MPPVLTRAVPPVMCARTTTITGGGMSGLTVYVASSFRHLHAVRLLNRELRRRGFTVLDWTEKAVPPEGLNAAQRREWMDTDHGGEVFAFCARACLHADVVLYMGTAGQDAGVEVGMAYGAGVPVLGLRGPLESPGLMLHGAGSLWVDSMDRLLTVLDALAQTVERDPVHKGRDAAARLLERFALDPGAESAPAPSGREG